MEEQAEHGRAKIRVLETAADLGLAIEAPTLGELYAAAGYGFTTLTTDPTCLQRRHRRQLEVEAPDRAELLVRWIEALIVLFELDGFLSRELEVRVQGSRLRAELRGDLFDPERHPLYAQVKAATYHRLSLTGPKPWRGEVILDV